jgi:DNA repair exonuclease SbcCD nuclease subunit
MKVALITDQHFGARNDSIHFLDFYEKFYSGTFFPTLEKEGIKTVLILGDTFDRRKYVNFYSLHRAKRMFFDPLAVRGIQVYMLIGNHDTYYRNTNEVNSPELVLEDYGNINPISSPCVIDVGGTNILMMPWICSENHEESLNMLKTAKADICMGHFEIAGFAMYRGMKSEEGLERDLFRRFDFTFSGHYHHKSSNGDIHYLGNPYELTWQDYGDSRGFHIFDTTTRKLDFIKNPNSIFHKITYDDKSNDIKTIAGMDLSVYKNTYVKVVVVNKTNPYVFDMFINKLYEVGTLDITIAEDLSEQDDETEDGVDQAEDTVTILNKYVENLTTDLDKSKLKDIMKQLYVEALNEEA